MSALLLEFLHHMGSFTLRHGLATNWAWGRIMGGVWRCISLEYLKAPSVRRSFAIEAGQVYGCELHLGMQIRFTGLQHGIQAAERCALHMLADGGLLLQHRHHPDTQRSKLSALGLGTALEFHPLLLCAYGFGALCVFALQTHNDRAARPICHAVVLTLRVKPSLLINQSA